MNQENLSTMINDCLSRLQSLVKDKRVHGDRVIMASGKASLAAAKCLSEEVQSGSQFSVNNIVFMVTDIQPQNMIEEEWVFVELTLESGKSLSGYAVNIDEASSAIFAF